MVTGIGIDVGVVVFILISAILAAARGFTREILSLATWAGSAAFAAFLWFTRPEANPDKSNPLVALSLQLHELAKTLITDPLFAAIGLSAVSFLVVLIILHLLTMWIADLVVDSRVGPLDRTLGFIFGLARGVLIMVVLAAFAGFLGGGQTTAGQTRPTPTFLADSRTYPPLWSMSEWVIARLPPDLAKQLSDWVEQRGGEGTGGEEAVTPPENVGTDASSEPAPAA